MRRRLLVSGLATVAIAVVLLGLPLGVAARVLAERRALDSLERQAAGLQGVLAQGADPAQRSALLVSVARDSGLHLVLSDVVGGDLLLRTDTAPGEPGPPPSDARRALANGAIVRSHDGGMLAVTVPVQAAGLRQALGVSVPDDALAVEIRRSWFGIAALGAVALAMGALVAVAQGRRLAAPVEQLAVAARRLGDGDFSVRQAPSGIPEPDQVAAALADTAARLEAMLVRSRSFSADASHQLRTPLTALRLDLEALEAGTADAAVVADAQREADRLEQTLDELLALTESPAGTAPIDLAALARERAAGWDAAFAGAGRRLEVRAPHAAWVRARPAAVAQGLGVLLDNALEHGSGPVRVEVGSAGGGARVCVLDEGAGVPEAVRTGVPPADDSEGRGRGLPLARALVEAEGGRLVIDAPSTGARVCLVLPEGTSPPASSAHGTTPSAASSPSVGRREVV